MRNLAWCCLVGAAVVSVGLCALFALAVLSVATVGIGPGLTDFTADFGNGCKLIQSSAHTIRITIDGRFDEDRWVPAEVVACGFDRQFVIAKQQQLDAKDNPISGSYQFWIIDCSQKQRYGPFSDVEFAAQRKKLGVPDSIRLWSPGWYRP